MMGKSYAGYYDHFFVIMRSINARLQMPEDRPLKWRVFFVSLHNIIPAMYVNCLFNVGLTDEFKNKLCILVGFAAFYTRLLTYIPKEKLLKFKELILIGQAEQASAFTLMIISAANRLHEAEWMNGDLITGLIIALCIIHIRQGSIYVEELLLGGVGGFNLGSVPTNYFSHLTAMPALYYFVSTSLGFPIELVIPDDEKCMHSLWSRYKDSECRIRISGWKRALSYENPEDLIVYDAIHVAIMVWFYYGAVKYIRALRAQSKSDDRTLAEIKKEITMAKKVKTD